jgi:hypothetical protein
LSPTSGSEAAWGSRDNDDKEEDQKPWHREATMMSTTAMRTPLDFSKSSVDSSVPFASGKYEHRNSVLFHIHSFIAEEMGSPIMVE